MSDDGELRAAWTTAVGDGPAELAALDDVLGDRQPHRRYHGVRHVTWVVRHVHELAAAVPVADVDAIVAAAFFHDAVYDPRADNEAQSAALAERVLGELGWPADRCATVGRLVRATERHDATDDDPDGRVLLDADLAVLGSEPAAYQAYVTGVRAEYAHVDEARWRAGRAAVLRDLLARRPLYATAAARTRAGSTRPRQHDGRAGRRWTEPVAAASGGGATRAAHPERDQRGGRAAGRRDGACERSDGSDDSDQHGTQCTDVRPCIQRD